MRIRGSLRNLFRRLRSRPMKLAAMVLLVLAAAGLAVAGRAWQTCGFGECPDVSLLTAYQPGGASLLLDWKGEPFADLAPVEHETVPLHALPTRVVQAFVAVEDKRFQEHHGIDWRRVGGALIANLRSGSFAQGFSTITMQLARNLYPEEIPGAERTTGRKLLEIRVAREIEDRFSKDEILELYLNHIYFGNGMRGIEAAARHYFGRPASQLTLAQAALLAALPKAPTHYDPRQHPEAARERRDLVLALMVQQGRVPYKEADAAQASPLGVQPPPRRAERSPDVAPYFVEAVRRELEEKLGTEIYRRPVRVWTTLDTGVQRAAEEELARQLAAIEEGDLGRFRNRRYSPSAAPSAAEADGPGYLQGAVVVLSAAEGDVLAWVGGRDFRHSQFDRVANARRQPGSAWKPFVYAAALAEGWALSQPLSDRPLTVRLPSGETWQPKNFYGRYEDRVTVRDALVRSKNVATVRLANEVGADDIAALAVRAGIEPPIPRLPAMPLGITAVSPLELTAAYTAFAGLGRGVRPRLVRRVETPEGRLLWQSKVAAGQVLPAPVAFLVTDVLREALERGSGTEALAAGVRGPAAGKTGTSNGGVDAWFVGYTPQLVAGVWIGFDKPQPIADEASGGRLAAPVWGRLLARATRSRPEPPAWTAPPGVVERSVDPATGLVLARGCRPTSGKPYRELFLAGREPQAFCPGKEGVPVAGFYTRERALAQEAERRNRRRQEEQLAAQSRQQEAARQAQLARQRQEAERLAAERRSQDERLAAQRQEQEKAEQLAAQRREAEQRAGSQEDERLTAQQRAAREAAEEARAAQVAAAAEKARQAEQERARRAAALAAREAELQERERKIAEEERRAAQQEKERRAERREDDAAPRTEEDETERRARVEEADDVVDDIEISEPDPERDEADAGDTADVSGWWELSNRIETTNFPAYRGLRLGYRILLEQDGDRITGQGQKWSENGRRLPAAQRTPITITGSVEGGRVRLRFTEQGARRSSGGSFSWRLTPGGDRLSGSFASSAADTSGSSSAWRIP
jgi:penicillin-binding protein 1A